MSGLPPKRTSDGKEKAQFPFQRVPAATASPVPLDPRVGQEHTWTRSNQTLPFDQGKVSENLLTYHIPIRFPPIHDGFLGFTYNADGNGDFGIPGAKAPFQLVGVVIEVTAIPFKCKNTKEFELPTPLAKLVYGLLEDVSGHMHAIALTFIKPSTLIRGMGLTDKAFNLAGFPPKLVIDEEVEDAQALIMGIQHHRPEFCPPGTSPIFRVGWHSARKIYGDEGPPRYLDLVSSSELTAAPGHWLSYKLMDSITMEGEDLRTERAKYPSIDKLYEQAGVMGIQYAPPYAAEGKFVNFMAVGRRTYNASPNPYAGVRDIDLDAPPFFDPEALIYATDGEAEEDAERMTEGDREAEVNSNNLGGMGSSSAGSTSSSLGVQLPDFGKFGTSPWEEVLRREVSGDLSRAAVTEALGRHLGVGDNLSVTGDDTTRVYPEYLSSRPLGIAPGGLGESNPGGEGDTLPLPLVVDHQKGVPPATSELGFGRDDGLSTSAEGDMIGGTNSETETTEERGEAMAEDQRTACNVLSIFGRFGLFKGDNEAVSSCVWSNDLPHLGELCGKHSEQVQALCLWYQEVKDQSSGESSRVEVPIAPKIRVLGPSGVTDPEDSLVNPSRWWNINRGRGAGQSFPPASAWEATAGFAPIHLGSTSGPLILKSERRTQLELINREHRLAFYLRRYYPSGSQPYPIYWNMDDPLPNSEASLTLVEALIPNLDVIGGLGQLERSFMVVVMRVEPDWSPGLDRDGVPTLPHQFPVMLCRVAGYDHTLGELTLYRTESLYEPEEPTIRFDREHVTLASEDMVDYWKWCVNWIQAKRLSQVEPDDVRWDYQYVLLGRVPLSVASNYSSWIHVPRIDQGIYTHVLRALNPEEYERRRDLGKRIYTAELAEIRGYGIRACTPELSDEDLDILLGRDFRPRYMRSTEPTPARTQSWERSSAGPSTPLSMAVRNADPQRVSRESMALASQLFQDSSLKDLRDTHVRWLDGSSGYATPLKPPDINSRPSEQLSGGARVAGSTPLGFYTPTPRRGTDGRSSSVPSSSTQSRPNTQSTRGWQQGKAPVPDSARTPEIQRLAALRLAGGDLPQVGRYGAKSGKTSDEKKEDEEISGGSGVRGDRKSVRLGGPPLGSTPKGGTRLDPPKTPGFLGDNFDHEPSGDEEDSSRLDTAGERSDPRRREDWSEGPTGTKAFMDSMRRMAVATESSALFKTQGDIYKDLNLMSLQYEMLSNPTLGVVLTMIPTVYHIYGVTGHLPPLTPQMTGPTRYRTTMDYFYQEAPWSAPALLMELRIKLTPRLLIVLTFGIFRGTMAFHPSDIIMVPENNLHEMCSPHFHLSGKSLPPSGLAKLTAPDPTKLTHDFTAFWELLDHFVSLFCLVYGVGHRVPLTTLVQELKDLRRRDYGLTTREMADLFTRILGFHQEKIISAFTASGGLLAHIKCQEDLLAEASRTDVDLDLMPRLVPWPSFVPGSPAYTTFYLGPREFMYQFQRDISVRKLREDTDAARIKKPIKPGKYGGEIDEDQDVNFEGRDDSIPEDLGPVGAVMPKAPGPGVPRGPRAEPGPDKPKPRIGPRPKPFVLTTEQMAKGTYALFELQQHLCTTKVLKDGQEICIRYLSHAGCTKCDRVHLPREALSGITISPWLKILMITHKGYRGEALLGDPTAQLRALARLVKAGKA